MLSFRKVLICIAMVLGISLSIHAAEETVAEHDNSRLSLFVQPAVSFINFEHRKYFQNAVDTIYKSFMENAVSESESLTVAKQDFQKVNFCFPVTAGLQYQILQDHFISAGIGFIYDNESVVLKDRKNRAHNYSYTIQGVPLFLEYRLAIPKNFMSLSNASLFSISARWYWVLPGTEIYTTWGMLEAKTPITGAGFGISFGYLVASWKGFNVYGDIGFSSISVESNKKFSDIVDGGPEEKAKWNVGGLQMQFRVSYGVWNKPKALEDTTDTKKKLNTKTSAKISKDDASLKPENAVSTKPENATEVKPGDAEIKSSDAKVKPGDAAEIKNETADIKNETAPDKEGEKVTPEE